MSKHILVATNKALPERVYYFTSKTGPNWITAKNKDAFKFHSRLYADETCERLNKAAQLKHKDEPEYQLAWSVKEEGYVAPGVRIAVELESVPFLGQDVKAIFWDESAKMRVVPLSSNEPSVMLRLERFKATAVEAQRTIDNILPLPLEIKPVYDIPGREWTDLEWDVLDSFFVTRNEAGDPTSVVTVVDGVHQSLKLNPQALRMLVSVLHEGGMVHTPDQVEVCDATT